MYSPCQYIERAKNANFTIVATSLAIHTMRLNEFNFIAVYVFIVLLSAPLQWKQFVHASGEYF